MTRLLHPLVVIGEALRLGFGTALALFAVGELALALAAVRLFRSEVKVSAARTTTERA